MKLIEYFDAFPINEVNLNASRLARLNDSVTAITSYLRESQEFSENFIDVIPQGSYAHRTIIKPVREEDEFDADILLYLTPFEDWQPANYVNQLHKCFCRSTIYKDKAVLGKRCVTIDYASDFHVDVVPYMERHGKQYITNRPKNDYELTNPEGYNEWLEEQHRIANYTLVKVIRLVKYLRDRKDQFDAKSFVLNVLLGQRINAVALTSDPGCYADVPTTLRTVMNRLSEYVNARPLLPTIMDPSGTGENLSDRWNQTDYARFRTAIIRYATKIDSAWLEEDKPESIRKWQEIFGDKFQAPKTTEALVKASPSAISSYNNTEQQLSDLGIVEKRVATYQLRIAGRVMLKHGFRDYSLSRSGSKVEPGRRLEFKIDRCTVPEPYDIYWKVKNNGEEARQRNCVRGQIEKRAGARSIVEPTAFSGPHYVECYIVKNGVCVAKDRQEVTIL